MKITKENNSYEEYTLDDEARRKTGCGEICGKAGETINDTLAQDKGDADYLTHGGREHQVNTIGD